MTQQEHDEFERLTEYVREFERLWENGLYVKLVLPEKGTELVPMLSEQNKWWLQEALAQANPERAAICRKILQLTKDFAKELTPLLREQERLLRKERDEL